MKDQTWFNAIAISAVAGVLLFGSAMFLVGGHGAPAPAGSRTAGLPEISRTLAISYNAATGTFDYSTTSLSVPANTRVDVTITNYDTSTAALAVPWDNRVIGTFGGTEQVSSGGGTVTVTSLGPQQISHTFTMFGAFYNLSVPIPPAPSTGVPSVVSFSIVLTTPGHFEWGCMAYCGTMSPLEKMAGTLEVTG